MTRLKINLSELTDYYYESKQQITSSIDSKVITLNIGPINLIRDRINRLLHDKFIPEHSSLIRSTW